MVDWELGAARASQRSCDKAERGEETMSELSRFTHFPLHKFVHRKLSPHISVTHAANGNVMLRSTRR